MDRHLARVRRDLERLVARAVAGALSPVPQMHRFDATAHRHYRPAAVLLLLTPTSAQRPRAPGVDLFLVQRSPLLRQHPGQIALPGGRVDPGDDGPVATALRETHEEIGLAPQRVAVLGTLPRVAVPVSSFVVTPVLGWAPHVPGLDRVDDGEVLHTLRVPVHSLLEPSARATVAIHEHGSAGFAVHGAWVWGFTGNLLDHVFDELGWTRPWDRARVYRMSLSEAHGGPPATAEG